MSDDRKLMVVHLPLNVSTMAEMMATLADEYPESYIVPEGDTFVVWTGEVDQTGTDWPSFARDMLSNDPERIKQHAPEWLRNLMEGKQ